MGIRVDEDSLRSQLKTAGCERTRGAAVPEVPAQQRTALHRRRRYRTVPYLYVLSERKAHIGEVQSSLWPDDIAEEALANGINLL